MQKGKLILVLIPWILVILSLVFILRSCSKSVFPTFSGQQEIVVNHHMVVERMEALGKLELVKFYIKDIVEHEQKISWWPDPKAVLIVSGEVVGCINLAAVDSSDIVLTEDRITILLPKPEICYRKINHEQSRVFDISNMTFNRDVDLVDKAYKMAEIKLQESAEEMNILGHTKTNARIMLMPLFESISGKKVTLRFED